MQHTKTVFVMAALVMISIFFVKCFDNNSSSNNDPRGNQYAGTASCVGCHAKIAESYLHTNHYKTSSVVSSSLLKKIADTSKKYFYYRDSSHIRLEQKGDDFFQSAFYKEQKQNSLKFDVAFGSAEKAQSYGAWNGNQLFQLPLTYFASLNVWANSPGFPLNHPKFDRLIISGCFQCHATYIAKEDLPSKTSMAMDEKLYPNTVIYGIDCERCHGPAAAHVKYQQENPLVKTAKYITSIKSLSRDQQLDVCGTCHSGNDRTAERSILAFVPGDTLSNYYLPQFGFGSMDPSSDVHGKQMQLLQSSQCFQKSNITCGTCHDPHAKNTTTVFITKCMTCHQQSTHAAGYMKKIEQTKDNTALEKISCISCHMPRQISKVISFKDGTTEKNLSYYLRTHRIAVYKQ
jgi:hypothetical protein